MKDLIEPKKSWKIPQTHFIMQLMMNGIEN